MVGKFRTCELLMLEEETWRVGAFLCLPEIYFRVGRPKALRFFKQPIVFSFKILSSKLKIEFLGLFYDPKILLKNPDIQSHCSGFKFRLDAMTPYKTNIFRRCQYRNANINFCLNFVQYP